MRSPNYELCRRIFWIFSDFEPAFCKCYKDGFLDEEGGEIELGDKYVLEWKYVKDKYSFTVAIHRNEECILYLDRLFRYVEFGIYFDEFYARYYRYFDNIPREDAERLVRLIDEKYDKIIDEMRKCLPKRYWEYIDSEKWWSVFRG